MFHHKFTQEKKSIKISFNQCEQKKYTNLEVRKHTFLAFENFSLNTAFVYNLRMSLDFQEILLKLHPSHQHDSLLPRVPYMLIFHQRTLQETKSRSKIWFPYKFGSLGINRNILSIRNFRVLRNPLQNTLGNKKISNSAESNRVAFLHTVKA